MENVTQKLIIQKRLSKYTSEQLLKKVSNPETKLEEIEVAKEILEKRNFVADFKPAEIGKTIKPKEVVVKTPKKIEEKIIIEATKIVEETKSSDRPIANLIDDIYDLEDKKYNKLLCDCFPEDCDYDDYEQLPEDAKLCVKNLHIGIFNPVAQKVAKAVLANKKEVKEKPVYTEEIPAGFKIGDKVKFIAFKTKLEIVGYIKRYFFDKQDNAWYFLIRDSDSKTYCKTPGLVSKV